MKQSYYNKFNKIVCLSYGLTNTIYPDLSRLRIVLFDNNTKPIGVFKIKSNK